MKKLLIIALLGFATALPAQNKVYHVPVQAQNSIVRNYIPNGKWIVYYETPSSERHFALTDLNDFHDVTINTDFMVKDFEVIDDTVIFCGSNNGNSAFIGWFHIPSFFTNASSYQIDYNINIVGLNSLDNIEVYRNLTSGFLHIAGYGHDNAATSNNFHAFEAVCSAANLSVMNYRVKPVDCMEKVLDMTVTDNYVVLGGRNTYNSNPEIVLFPFPKYNMLGNTFDPYYHFSTSSTLGVVEPYNDQLKMTHISGDSVATATYQYVVVNGDKYLMLKKYDIGNTASMTTSAKVNHGSGNISIAGIEYNKLESTYYVLCDYRFLMPRLLFAGTISRLNYSSGIPPIVDNDLYQYATDYSSLCKDNGYLAAGIDSRTNDLIFYRGELTYETSCDPGIQETVQSVAATTPATATCTRTSTYYVPVNWANKTIVNYQKLPATIICE